MFEQTFKNIDDALRKEADARPSWITSSNRRGFCFLEYLDDLEVERATKAELEGKPYAFIIGDEHRWSHWAAPRKADGSLDQDNALTGDDLIAYVNDKCFLICAASGSARRARRR
jgi:type I restriction enzyme M protein